MAAPMIDGAVTVATASKPAATKKSSSKKKAAAPPKKPASRSKAAPPPPKVYWFQGKAYTSQFAYAAALAAAQAATAAAAAARQRARATADAARRASLERVANQKRLLAYQAQAAAAARAKADQQRKLLASKAKARAEAETKRLTELRKRAENRQLLEVSARRNLLVDDRMAQADAARRAEEQRLATARRQAYEELQRRSAAALRLGRGAVIDDPSRRGFNEDPRRYKRQALVTQAETTGDWSAVLKELQNQSNRTNGRVVDDRLLEEVYAKYVTPIAQVRDEFSDLVADLEAAERAGDDEALLKLVEDPDNIALYERFLELFGDGTRPGAFTPHQEILAELSAARERAWVQQFMNRQYAQYGRPQASVTGSTRGGHLLADDRHQTAQERYADLEFTEQVLDPETGELVDVKRVGMDAWLAREQAREQVRVQEQYRAQVGRANAIAALAESEGHTFLGYDQDGRIVLRDNALDWQRRQIERWMPEWKLNEQGVPVRLAEAADNPGKLEQLIREFMADAAKAWERNNQDSWDGYLAAAQFRASQADVPVGARGGPDPVFMAREAWQRAKTEWLSAVARQLGKDGWGTDAQLSTTGIGGVAQAALTAMSLVPAAVRHFAQRDFGDVQPHVDVGVAPVDRSTLWGQLGLPPLRVQAGKTVDPNARTAAENLGLAWGSGNFFTDLGQWSSVIRDNAAWGTGNVGWALTQATDPLLLSGPGRFMKAGALATARVGGVAGLRAGGLRGVGDLAAQFARYSAPKFAGGVGRDVVKVELAKLRLAQKLGMTGTDALKLSDDEFRGLADELARGQKDELLKSDLIKNLSTASGIEKNQLLRMVEQELPRILREYKIFAEDPFQAAARMKAMRQAAERARSQAETAEQLAAMQAERQAAMAALSEVTGRPLKTAKLTAAQAAEHERLLGTFTLAAKNFREATERGLKAAEQLANAKDVPHRTIREWQRQLRAAEMSVKRYDQEWRLDPHGEKVLAAEGLVGRRFRELNEYRERFGGDPTAPSFVDQSLKQVAYDKRRINGLIRQALQKLRATPLDQRLPSEWTARLKQLRKAKQGLIYEEAMLDGGRTMGRAYGAKHFSRVERSITPQQVAPLATNSAQLYLETGRDFMRLLHGSKVRGLVKLSAKQEQALAALRVSAAGPVDVAGMVGSQAARLMVKALGRAPTLQELWTTVRMASADAAGRLEFEAARRALDTQMVVTARKAGFQFKGMKMRQAADYLWAVLRDDHSRLGADALNLSEYARLDAKVQAALVEWRRARATGQIRLRERRFAPPSGPEDMVFHDTDPYEVLVKQRVLSQEGVSIFAYDELRGTHRRTMLRQESAIGILERAVVRAADEGLDLEEAVRLERAAAAREEVLRNVEEHFARPDLQGLPPEARLRSFEERLMLDDMPQAVERQISPYQEQSLRAAFQEQTGFSFDDKHLIARWFRGEMDALPEGARPMKPGEFHVTPEEAAAMHLGVVPPGHPRLDPDIPFARRRDFEDEVGELLEDAWNRGHSSEISKEARAIMRSWEDNLSEGVDESVIGKQVRREGDDIAVARLTGDAVVLDEQLPEAAAGRRGADAGRRQNAAAEARRSSRRNFDVTPGGRSGPVHDAKHRAPRTYGWIEEAAPPDWQTRPGWVDMPIEMVGPRFGMPLDEYRQWLWDQMRASSDFRNQMAQLHGKHIVYSSGGHARVLADAVNWLRTKEAREMFSPQNPHPARLTGRDGQAGTRAQLVSKLAEFEEAHRVARDIAGFEWQVTRGRWVPAREGMLAIGEGAGDDIGDRAAVWQRRGRNWVEVKDREVSRAGLPSLVDLKGKDKPHHVFESVDGQWVRTSGSSGDLAVRRVAALEARINEIKRSIERLDADDGSPSRHRGARGISIRDEGVYVAEGTGDVTVQHEFFHQFWDDPFNRAWRTEIEDAIDLMGMELRSGLWRYVRVGTAAYDPAEFAAELYALWKVGDDIGGDAVYSWSDLRGLLDEAGQAALDGVARRFAEGSPQVVDTISGQLHFPPVATPHRARLLRWFEERGHFSPRTGEAIREGEQAWSVVAEDQLYTGFMEYKAPWLDPDVLKVILNDGRLLSASLRLWGFFEDDFETMAASTSLTPKQLRDGITWGQTLPDGTVLKRQRSATELRRWAIQRYGSLVTEDGKTLTRMPWLMRADNEYVAWTNRFFDEAVGQESSARAARDKLPEVVRNHLFDGDTLRSAGIQIDPRLVKAQELRKLRDAIGSATRRRLDRLKKAGDIPDDKVTEWLAQEQLRFAYEVTDQLLVDPVWRGLLRGKPIAGVVLRLWGQLWRLLVSWQPAFPIMNLLESYGFKRLYLTVYEGGFRPLSLDADGRRIVRDLRQIGAESDSIFHLSGGSPWGRVGDRNFDINHRGGALVQGITELPVRISKFGEDALRLDFARRVAGDTFRAARRTGMDVENAEWLARHEAKRLVESFFAISKGAGWQTALNELVPFFSYNFKNKTLALRIMWNHPSVWVWGERIRRELEEANREEWAREHPGVEFPEGPSASWLWWKVGDEYYKIDLSAFSDWTRAMGAVAEDHTPLEWFHEFLRVPHPSQMGAWAMFTGEDTPWGRPGHIREMSIWADLFYWTRGIDHADPRHRRTLIQIMSKLLFFKEFGHTGAMEVKQATFFSLQDLDEDLARQYLEANPDLQIYWDSLPSRGNRIKGFDPFTRTHFRSLMTEEQNAEYDRAMAEYDALNDRLDAMVAAHAAQPWSDEYKTAKREAHLARRQFLAANPILGTTWGAYMRPQEFAAFVERSRVDDLADAWFNWKRPKRDDYADELAYNQALVAFNERRAAFLDAHPALRERLEEGRTAVETAWRGQELHWTEVLDFQARLKIRILEEEARGDDADRDLIDLLYRARDFASADLDADVFGVFSGPVTKRAGFFASLPGFADFRYARATPAERAQMDRDQAYVAKIKALASRVSSGKEFYQGLEADPALMAEYFARNPDKEAQYKANKEYIRWIGSWARNLEARNFVAAQAVWDSMPDWVKERYFAKHPDSGMRDGMGGGSTAVQYKGKWFKSPESRDRYIRWIEGGGTGASPEPFVEGEQRFRSEESRRRFLDGQAYFASMGRWVELLKAKDFVAADRYFKGLPEWMKEKYYAKHPDQRARAELDSEVLRRGAEYFLAQGDDKLKILERYPQLRRWLADNGGEEGAMRGLVQAMYRAIPSSEPWLKRTFRERFPEIFGQEAAGERRLRAVASELAEHPEMLPFYEKALRLQSQLFIEQLRRSKAPPSPWTMERKSRLKKRTKRRAARLSAHWSLHRDLRRGR